MNWHTVCVCDVRVDRLNRRTVWDVARDVVRPAVETVARRLLHHRSSAGRLDADVPAPSPRRPGVR
jgi:hypothetical protein